MLEHRPPYAITDFGEPLVLQSAGGGSAPMEIKVPRYGVWGRVPSKGNRHQVIECSDDLAALCKKYGLKAEDVVLLHGAHPNTPPKPSTPPCCQKCGTPLAGEYCGDETCPYSDWPQTVPLAAVEDQSAADILARQGVKKRLRVRAEAHSDDRVFETEFDATLYVEQATNEQLEALRDCGFGGDHPADVVAAFYAKGDNELAQLFAYLNRVRGTGRACGFECHVDEGEAMAWLSQNRPALVVHNADQEHSPNSET